MIQTMQNLLLECYGARGHQCWGRNAVKGATTMEKEESTQSVWVCTQSSFRSRNVWSCTSSYLVLRRKHWHIGRCRTMSRSLLHRAQYCLHVTDIFLKLIRRYHGLILPCAKPGKRRAKSRTWECFCFVLLDKLSYRHTFSFWLQNGKAHRQDLYFFLQFTI